MQAFDTSFPMMMNRALDAVMPAYRELFARYQVTEQQWRVLRVIWTSESVNSAMLSERTLLSPPSLVNIIDRLETKGLVSRVRSAEDRRQIYVVATEAGRQLQQEVTPHLAAIQEQIRNCVSEKEWQALHDILDKINTGISARAAMPPEVQAKAS